MAPLSVLRFGGHLTHVPFSRSGEADPGAVQARETHFTSLPIGAFSLTRNQQAGPDAGFGKLYLDFRLAEANCHTSNDG